VGVTIDGGVKEPKLVGVIILAVCIEGRAVVGGDGADGTVGGVNKVGLVGLGTPKRRLFVFPEGEIKPRGLGLRLLKLPIGLVNPLRRPGSAHGATTAISSDAATEAVRISAALSRTEGTLCSSCSVALERGMRWGLWECEDCGDGQTGSISRSKIAEDDECLGDI